LQPDQVRLQPDHVRLQAKRDPQWAAAAVEAAQAAAKAQVEAQGR